MAQNNITLTNDHSLIQVSLVKFTDEQIVQVAEHLDTSEALVRKYLAGDVPRNAEVERAFYACTNCYPFQAQGKGRHWTDPLKDFDTYQQRAGSTAIYPSRGKSLCYPALGLAGEAGEVAEKVKKLVRGEGDLYAKPDADERAKLAGELGDILWYVAALCFELDLKMSDVARTNLEKLASRKERGVIHGSGDDR